MTKAIGCWFFFVGFLLVLACVNADIGPGPSLGPPMSYVFSVANVSDYPDYVFYASIWGTLAESAAGGSSIIPLSDQSGAVKVDFTAFQFSGAHVTIVALPKTYVDSLIDKNCIISNSKSSGSEGSILSAVVLGTSEGGSCPSTEAYLESDPIQLEAGTSVIELDFFDESTHSIKATVKEHGLSDLTPQIPFPPFPDFTISKLLLLLLSLVSIPFLLVGLFGYSSFWLIFEAFIPSGVYGEFLNKPILFLIISFLTVLFVISLLLLPVLLVLGLVKVYKKFIKR